MDGSYICICNKTIAIRVILDSKLAKVITIYIQGDSGDDGWKSDVVVVGFLVMITDKE